MHNSQQHYQSTILAIPPEIRLRIYPYVLSESQLILNDGTITWKNGRGDSYLRQRGREGEPARIQLLHVCQRLRIEVVNRMKVWLNCLCAEDRSYLGCTPRLPSTLCPMRLARLHGDASGQR
jgi:hypothetical protein